MNSEQQQPASPLSSSHSNSSGSLVRVDEISSFGASKQSRLPALIKPQEATATNQKQPISMPTYSGTQVESTASTAGRPETSSLPGHLLKAGAQTVEGDKENQMEAANELDESSSFQLVDMEQVDPLMMGPSLPAPMGGDKEQPSLAGPPSHPGDSLIELVINLRNENQDLVRALTTNNEFVKGRLEEFKKVQEEAKRREIEWASEKAEFEHKARKLSRQNQVLSERLVSMEAKLKDLRLEVGESLNAAHSSKASSLAGGGQDTRSAAMYPDLPEAESFANSALLQSQMGANQQVTMEVDAANNELRNQGDRESLAHVTGSSSDSESSSGDEQDDEALDRAAEQRLAKPSAPEMAAEVAAMTKEELAKRFDARKAEFYAIDDPMKQCDKLEQQLNDIGKRDYEICLLQQQLNIYRQDYRLEKMANLEAKIQIEKLKNDIDRLCLERVQQRQEATNPKQVHGSRHSGRHHRLEAATAAADAVLGRLGKRAAKTAAKAARYAAKQAHLDEKVAARAAAAAAYAANATPAPPTAGPSTGSAPPPSHDHRHHKRHHHRHHQHAASGATSGLRAVKNEVVNDLMSTANKAMLTGYRMASTHVNLALEKLSEFEQKQASSLAKNKTSTSERPTVSEPRPKPSGTLMQHHDLD